MIKSELRKAYLSKQKAIPPQDRAAKSKAISDLVFETGDLDRVKTLHLFLPIQRFNEIDTRLIVERVWKECPHIQTVVPRVDFETNELTSVRFARDTKLAPSSWGIEEPVHDDLVETAEIDMVLVPGLAFDRRGHRVGYGKGYYDRFLAKCRPDCVKIGLNYFPPVDVIDDVHAGDMRVDLVVTPSRVIGIQD